MAPSIAYNYFDTSEDSPYAICKLCSKSIRCRMRGFSLDPSHLLRHLRLKHPDLSPELTQGSKASLKDTKISHIHKLEDKVKDFFCKTDSAVAGSSGKRKQWHTSLLEKPNDISNIMSNTHNEMNLDPEDLKLIHPFSLIISGPTASGKSTLLFQILENLHQNTKPAIQKVVFIYGVYQEVYKNYPNIFFTDDLDYMDVNTDIPTLIVLDDVMSSINSSKKLEELFTRGVHHRKVSVVLTLQNLFYHGSVMKTLRDNAMYIILTKHIQDVSKLNTFARQLEQKNSNYFKDSYQDAVSKKYGYIACDLHPHSDLRDGAFKIKYRSLIHKPEGQILYLPKSQGMLKAVIQSNIPDVAGMVKASIQSGKTIPDTFILSTPELKKESLPPRHQVYDIPFVETKASSVQNMESLPSNILNKNVCDDSQSDLVEASSDIGDYYSNDNNDNDNDGDHDEMLEDYSDDNDSDDHDDDNDSDDHDDDNDSDDHDDDNDSDDHDDDNDSDDREETLEDYSDDTDEEEENDFTLNDYPLSYIEKIDWFIWFNKQSSDIQCKTIQYCNDNFITDLHKLINHIAYDKNVKISPIHKQFFKKHKIFLRNFIEERSLKKKRAQLLQKVNVADLGLLINVLLVSVSKPVRLKVFEKKSKKNIKRKTQKKYDVNSFPPYPKVCSFIR